MVQSRAAMTPGPNPPRGMTHPHRDPSKYPTMTVMTHPSSRGFQACKAGSTSTPLSESFLSPASHLPYPTLPRTRLLDPMDPLAE
eukprot:762723-Hanusia_phi.AAC.17